MSDPVSPPPPPPTPQPAAKKKGLSPLAWVGIGCLVLLILAGAAFFSCSVFVAKKAKQFTAELEEDPLRTVAELAVKANPDLEIVETDEEAGTLTVRERSTGQQVTLDYQEIASGRWSIETEEGSMEFDASRLGEEGTITVRGPDGETTVGGGGDRELPDWIPVYPGASRPQFHYYTAAGNAVSGAFDLTATDPPRQLADFYRERLERAGLDLQVTETSSSITVVATGSDRSLQMTLVESDGATRATIIFQSGG